MLEVRNMDVCNLKIWFDRVYKTYRILSQLNYFPENIWEYIYHCEGQVNLANENQNIRLFWSDWETRLPASGPRWVCGAGGFWTPGLLQGRWQHHLSSICALFIFVFLFTIFFFFSFLHISHMITFDILCNFSVGTYLLS